ncbi:MAG: hypothetical protein Q8S73_34570 [Deltaproteobacteria bacterium]|nr:hypothetical protein [Myxococcales bacterium]MDP3219275.1 hypothetical protein [Deltaproteobacteria bacterium]
MLPTRVEVGSDVYRATTVQGPYPAFDSGWVALRRAFALFRRCLPTLARAASPVLVPLAVCEALSGFLPRYHDAMLFIPPASALLNALAMGWTSGVTAHVAWRQVEGRAVTVREARAVGSELVWRMFAARFSYAMHLIIGAILWVVPGLYWAGKYGLAEPVVYFERSRCPSEAMARSAALTSGVTWRVTGVMLVVGAAWLVGLFSADFLVSLSGAAAWRVVSGALLHLVAPFVLTFASVLRMVIYLGLAGVVPERTADVARASADR